MNRRAHPQSKILLTSSPSKSGNPSPHYIICFIPGNPGLISYYTTFLQHLQFLLFSSSSPSAHVSSASNPHHAALGKDAAFSFTTYGECLFGFEGHEQGVCRGAAADSKGGCEGDDEEENEAIEMRIGKGGPLDLSEQIEVVEGRLEGMLASCEEEANVILIGHSVGAYILLEILSRWGRRGAGKRKGGRRARIVGGVCLFPTIMDIGRSRSGRVFTTLSSMPYFDVFVSNLALLLTCLIPTFMLAYLVRLLLRMSRDAAYTTATFVKNRKAVRQSLYMAADEMRTITHDRWDEGVWGASRSSSTPDTGAPVSPKLYFLFGRNDHWVADSTRDDLIAARAYRAGEEGGSWKPKMEVDDMGLPHGFCIHHSIPVAAKVKGYIEEIVRADLAERRLGRSKALRRCHMPSSGNDKMEATAPSWKDSILHP